MDKAISDIFVASLAILKNDLVMHLSKTLSLSREKVTASLDSFKRVEQATTPLTLIEDYSEKAVVLIGNTKPYDLLFADSKLLTKGHHYCGIYDGWVSSKTHLEKIKHFLRTHKIEYITKSRSAVEKQEELQETTAEWVEDDSEEEVEWE
jgi:hypothetical protein